MTMSRRNAVVGLLAMPGILTAMGEGAQDPKPGPAPDNKDILGPHVFEWDQMQFHKTATGEVIAGPAETPPLEAESQSNEGVGCVTAPMRSDRDDRRDDDREASDTCARRPRSAGR